MELYSILPIYQEDIDNYISTNSINTDNWEFSQQIAAYFFEKQVGSSPEECNWLDQEPFYIYNPYKKAHEIIISYFLDHKTWSIQQKQLLEITDQQTARQLADTLRFEFSDDKHLMGFADWLDNSSIYCTRYELGF